MEHLLERMMFRFLVQANYTLVVVEICYLILALIEDFGDPTA